MLRVISSFYRNLWPTVPRATHLKGLSLHFCKNLKSNKGKMHTTPFCSVSHKSQNRCHSSTVWLRISVSIHLKPRSSTPVRMVILWLGSRALCGQTNNIWHAARLMQLILWLTLPGPSHTPALGRGVCSRAVCAAGPVSSSAPDKLDLFPASGQDTSLNWGRERAVIIAGNGTCNATLMADGLMLRPQCPLFKHD